MCARDLIQTISNLRGIETTAQLTALRSLGCTLGQGYYLSRPLEAEHVPALFSGSSIRIPASA